MFEMLTSVPGIVAVAILFLAVGFGAGWFAARTSGRGGRAATGGATTQKSSEDGERTELYVGNLSYEVESETLQKAFAAYGKVLSCRVIENKFNGKSKGYGFIEMADRTAAMAAIKGMNGVDMQGRRMVVNEAKSSPRD